MTWGGTTSFRGECVSTRYYVWRGSPDLWEEGVAGVQTYLTFHKEEPYEGFSR